jgi:uncharacterized protein YraI
MEPEVGIVKGTWRIEGDLFYSKITAPNAEPEQSSRIINLTKSEIVFAGDEGVPEYRMIKATAPSNTNLATPAPQTYRVVGVSSGDYLNVRQGPGANYSIVARLLPTATGIVLEQGRTTNGSTVWQQISKGGYTGWINEEYLTLETGSQLPSYSGTATSPALPASTPIRTVSVYFERSYLIDERYGTAAENKIALVEQYIAKYTSLREQKSALNEKLKKSGPLGKSRLQKQISEITATMTAVERDGDREILQLRSLLQKAEVKSQ